MKKTVETDVAIIGGGIAGLWLLNRLRQLGLSVILLESGTLGGGQTSKAQGIIHGGMKYALQGALTHASHTISDMPELWQQCLLGKGVINLSKVPVLSSQQYLWATGSLTSKLVGFFAGFTLKSSVETLKKESYPTIFQHPDFHGQVYSLDEMVIDVNSLIRELAKPNHDVIFKIDPMQENMLQFDAAGRLETLQVQFSPTEPITIRAQKYIFTAGSGNELLQKKIKNKDIVAQRRPLHMVLVKTDFSCPLYAHCLGLGAVPRVTITTHQSHDGKNIWYIGGQLAEEGVKRDKEKQIEAAKKELQELFPWLDFSNAEFNSFLIDRSEPAQPEGKRPDSCYATEIENIIVAWPTKLALAPKLAEEIISLLQKSNIEPHSNDVRALRAWPFPAFAKPIWDELL